LNIPRILVFLSDFEGGGAQRTLLNLVGAMPRDKMTVDLAVGNANGPAQLWVPEGVAFYDLGAKRVAAAIPKLVRLIKQTEPDVILSTMIHANIAAFTAVRLARSDAALVLRETNPHRPRRDLSSIHRRLAAYAYRGADLVIALSEGVRKELVADMRLPEEQTLTIPNPVMVRGIAERVAEAKKGPSPWRGDGPRILSIGRFVRQKAYEVLLDAAAAYVPDANLILLGDGPDREKLTERAAKHGLRVTMPGFVDKPYAYLAHADLFVLSSRWEGFGHVIVEAMAAELPVVATDCPHGPAEIIQSGSNGLLAKNENSDELGRAIKRVVGDRAFARKLAAAGRQSANRYQSEKIAGEYAKALSRVARQA